MFDLETFKTTPFGSMLDRPEEEQARLTEIFSSTSGKIRKLLTSSHSGAFIRGVVKGLALPVEKSQLVAFSVLQVVLGEKKLAQLPGLLAAELKLPADKAQRMAREIEQDLLGPVKKELEEYWRRQKDVPGQDNKNAGAINVLNLREQKRSPQPPPMPRGIGG